MEAFFEILGVTGIIIAGFSLLVLGFIGSVMPGLPGAPFAVLSVWLLHLSKLHGYSWYTLLIVTFFGLVISLVDYVLPVWGTKKWGGTKAGVRGSTYGLIIGVLLTIFTSGIGVMAVIFGPFIGAFVGEKMAKSSNEVALKSAVGSLIGFLAGTFGKIFVVVSIGFVFLYGVVVFLFKN
jgi:uncharacterized protein YqgC (DUF456 family)